MFRTLVFGLLATVATLAQAGSLTLDVAAGDGNGHVRKHFVYDGNGCQGDNVAPALSWHGAPEDTKGFAVTVFDPDAGDRGWWHWVVLDIPPTTTGLAEGAELPAGALSLRNDFGHARWDGPCPPAGDPPHHYVFTVYALDTVALGIPASAEPLEAKAALERHTLGKASRVLTYARP